MSDGASWASRPDRSRGRQYSEPEGGTRGPRDAFQRDRDRIIHCAGFRRLRHKTQVFIAPEGDHYRVRLTHSLEVAQIGRTIARALGLNEDLTEALCLAHDIGHPPFGHAGEDGLTAAMAMYGGFDHNAHTLRVLTHLENPYPRFSGLNLSWEVLEGLAKHNGPVLDPPWALTEVDQSVGLELGTHPSLEAQVAAVADDIAYDNHDIDDGLRAGILTLEEILSIPLVAGCWDKVRRRYADVEYSRLARELVREQIGAMVNDVIDATRHAVASTGVKSPEDIRSAGRVLGDFSSAMRSQERDLKTFMYAELYRHPSIAAATKRAASIVGDLFAAYHHDPILMGDAWARNCPEQEPLKARYIGDFIAGMTDRYALDRHAGIFGSARAFAVLPL